MRPNGLLQNLRLLLTVYRDAAARRDEDPEVRVAVIMGAQVLKGGRPSRTLEARVRHAARLYQAGGFDLLIPTGGLGEHPPKEADLMTDMLLAWNVPPEAILPEDAALNTWDSAELVARIAEENDINRVKIVTDPLHCVRTTWAFGKSGLDALAEPAFDSPMWRKPWSRRGQLAREAVAVVWYTLKYGRGSRPPGGYSPSADNYPE